MPKEILDYVNSLNETAEYFTHDELESGLYYDDEYNALLRATALTHIHYFTEEGASITFCFDDHNEVSCVIFADSSTVNEFKY